MSDAQTRKRVFSDLPRWIEQDYRAFFARRNFQDYLTRSSERPFVELLRNYGARTDGANFPDFLDFLTTDKGVEALEACNRTRRENAQNPITLDILGWNAEYEAYQREQSIENPPTLEEFLKDSSGKAWRPALEAYLGPLEDKDRNTNLSGFLTFVNHGIDSKSTITFDQVWQNYLKDRSDAFLGKLHAFEDQWPPEELNTYIQDLNRSPIFYSFLLNGTPEKEVSKGLLKHVFALVCDREGILESDSQGRKPKEVTSECLKSPEGIDPINTLRDKLQDAWALTAILYHRSMSEINIITQNKDTSSCDLIINELAAQCASGSASVLKMLSDFVQAQTEGPMSERSNNRRQNSGPLQKGALSDSARAFLEVCRNQTTSTTPEAHQAVPSYSEEEIRRMQRLQELAGKEY
jgi:hypothetical protein